MSGNSDGAAGETGSKEEAAEPPRAGSEEEAKETARQVGISQDQALQLQRSTEEGTELDSAAEAAARWS
jgi:hypothetical protein